MPPTDPLEQYLLDHENDMHMNGRNGIDEIIFRKEPILKHNLHVEILVDPPPPKDDPIFELKKLPYTLKYAYLDEKKKKMLFWNLNEMLLKIQSILHILTKSKHQFEIFSFHSIPPTKH